MSTVPPFLILTATRTASGIRSWQVVECLDHYYQKDDANGIYIRSLFDGNKIGPKEVEPDPSRVNPKDFESMPHVIKRLFDDSVAPNDAYSVNVPNGSDENQIFNKPTDKVHITFPSLPTDEKKLAAFIFAFILCSIVGTKTDETYTSFDFSANSATPPLNVYTSADTAYNIDTPEEAERIRLVLKAMAIDFYAAATRNSLYIFKQPVVEASPPFVTDKVEEGSSYLFTIDLTKIDQSEFSSSGNLRVGLNADSGEPETVESLLGFNAGAGYILALITNQDVTVAPVA